MSKQLHWWLATFRQDSNAIGMKCLNLMTQRLCYVSSDKVPFIATITEDGKFSHVPLSNPSSTPNVTDEIHYLHHSGKRFKAIVKNMFVFHHAPFEAPNFDSAEASGIMAYIDGEFGLHMIAALHRIP